MKIVLTFEGRAALLKKSVENGIFRAFSPRKIFKKFTGMWILMGQKPNSLEKKRLFISPKLSYNFW